MSARKMHADEVHTDVALVRRLLAALLVKKADLAFARRGDQPHPVFCVCRKSVLPSLTSFLESGGRKIDAWYSRLKVVEVGFDDEADAFSNINTEAELRDAQARG